MITEIAQVKRFIADKYNLKTENYKSDLFIRVVDPIPEEGYDEIIPLGVSLTPTRVVIKNEGIYIDPKNM